MWLIKRYELSEPAYDIYCGDGRFRNVWPHLRDIVGIDQDPHIVTMARQSGLYREILESPALEIPSPPKRFAPAFANCSLERMNRLAEVLKRIHRCLQPGAIFLLSVFTERIIEWATLPLLVTLTFDPGLAQALQREYERYQHLANLLPASKCIEHLQRAEFQIREYIPILPEMTSRLFSILDHLWHVPRGVGDLLYPILSTLPDFSLGFWDILSGFLQMGRDFSAGSGAVLLARRI